MAFVDRLGQFMVRHIFIDCKRCFNGSTRARNRFQRMIQGLASDFLSAFGERKPAVITVRVHAAIAHKFSLTASAIECLYQTRSEQIDNNCCYKQKQYNPMDEPIHNRLTTIFSKASLSATPRILFPITLFLSRINVVGSPTTPYRLAVKEYVSRSTG